MSQEKEAVLLAENDEASVDVRIGKKIAGSIIQAHYHTQDEHGMLVCYSTIMTVNDVSMFCWRVLCKSYFHFWQYIKKLGMFFKKRWPAKLAIVTIVVFTFHSEATTVLYKICNLHVDLALNS